MQALVTGGAGFIGSTLVDRLLAEGWKVDVVDDLSSGSLGNLASARGLPDRRFSFHRLDVASSAVIDLITHRRPDVVFHLAAQIDVRVSVARPVFDATVNILGSLNVFEAAVAAGVQKVVFIGSGGTLYGSPDEIPTREGAPQHPESPYGVAKKAVGDYLHYYRAIRGLEYTVLALANVYGPRQDPHGEAGVQKVVFIGSGGTLYGSPDEIPTREGAPQHPESPYGVAKKAVGDYLHYYRAIRGLEYTVLALANVYGPRQDPHGEAGVVAIFANKLLDRDRPAIFGDGSQTRDFVYVDDVVDACARSVEKGGGLVLNIGTGIETSVQQLYDVMAKLSGFREPAQYLPPRAGEVERSALDPGRAQIHLGWKPFTPLEEGVARTLEHFKGMRR